MRPIPPSAAFPFFGTCSDIGGYEIELENLGGTRMRKV